MKNNGRKIMAKGIKESYENPWKKKSISNAVLLGLSGFGLVALAINTGEDFDSTKLALGGLFNYFTIGLVRNLRNYKDFRNFKKRNPGKKCDYNYYLESKKADAYARR